MRKKEMGWEEREGREGKVRQDRKRLRAKETCFRKGHNKNNCR